MKLGFATDIHLDTIVGANRPGCVVQRIAGETLGKGCDALVISGDISTGKHFDRHFAAFCEGAKVPVYFVLGNHDFWDAPESVVRATAATFPGYLDTAGVVELTPSAALVGRSGWYDTLSGQPNESKVKVDDWFRASRLLPSYSSNTPELLHRACQMWSEEETEKAIPLLEAAAASYQRVYFATHFPIFEPDGTPDIAERKWWPWSLNTTLGRALREVTDRHPNNDFTVLTGHTHRARRTQVSENLTCIGGKADFGNPQLAESWVV